LFHHVRREAFLLASPVKRHLLLLGKTLVGASVLLADLAGLDRGLELGRQPAEPPQLVNASDGQADFLGDLFPGDVQQVFQSLQCGGAIHVVQVLPLDVFDELTDQAIRVAEGLLVDDGRDPGQAGQVGRAPAAFAMQQLVALVRGDDLNGFQHALLADGGGQLFQALLEEGPAGLVRVRVDAVQRQLEDATGYRCRRHLGEAALHLGGLEGRFAKRPFQNATDHGFQVLLLSHVQ
jgi:hypothetical protein